MTKDKSIMDKKKAKKVLLVNKGQVHTFTNESWGLIGVDFDLKLLSKIIDEAYQVRLTGNQATAMGHGIAILPNKDCYQSEVLFAETTEEFNKKQLKELEKDKKVCPRSEDYVEKCKDKKEDCKKCGEIK